MRREVLRLVDDQQRALLVERELAEERLERREQDRLVDRLDRQPERRADCTQHVVGVELRADELRRDELVAVDVLEQVAHDRRLAGADFAGDDDEALALVEPILQVGERALVPAAAEVERRIGVELERLARQVIEGFVHGTSAERVSNSQEGGRFAE